MEQISVSLLLFVAISSGQYLPFPSTPAPFTRNFGASTLTPYYHYTTPRPILPPAFNPYYNLFSAPVPIPSYSNGHDIDGPYVYSLSGTDGKRVQDSGMDNSREPQGVQVIKGMYSYNTPDGRPIQVSYIFDENGFKTTDIKLVPEEKMESSPQMDKKVPEKENEKKNRRVFIDPYYNTYTNSYNGYNPYLMERFNYYSPINEYDYTRRHSFDLNRYRHNSNIRPTYNPWFNPYFDYNSLNFNFKEELNNKDM